MNALKQKLGLDHIVTYEIKVPGYISEDWSDWTTGMTITLENENEVFPVTILTGKLDQAALLGLLRRLYTLGLPLISAVCRDLIKQ